jgi:hypothetical protein
MNLSKFERIVQFLPAFDKRHPDPSKNYGIHGVELRMVLKGPKGAVQFVLFTNWQLLHITRESENRLCGMLSLIQSRRILEKGIPKLGKPEPIKKLIEEIDSISAKEDEAMIALDADSIRSELHCFWQPMAADLGYHSYVPLHEGQRAMGSVKYDAKAMLENLESLKARHEDGEQDFDLGEELIPDHFETGTFTPCEYLDDAPCFYDGSGLNAERIYKVLLEKGSDGVWQELEEYYEHTFKDVDESLLDKGIRSSESG